MFLSIIRHELLKIFLAITTILEIIVLYIDIINICLKNALKQNKWHSIYMRILYKYRTSWKNLICNIYKSLYKLKQARKL